MRFCVHDRRPRGVAAAVPFRITPAFNEGPNLQVFHEGLGIAPAGADIDWEWGCRRRPFARRDFCGRLRPGSGRQIGPRVSAGAQQRRGGSLRGGAGAVVGDDVPDYGVAAGVPATVLRYRRASVRAKAQGSKRSKAMREGHVTGPAIMTTSSCYHQRYRGRARLRGNKSRGWHQPARSPAAVSAAASGSSRSRK